MPGGTGNNENRDADFPDLIRIDPPDPRSIFRTVRHATSCATEDEKRCADFADLIRVDPPDPRHPRSIFRTVLHAPTCATENEKRDADFRRNNRLTQI